MRLIVLATVILVGLSALVRFASSAPKTPPSAFTAASERIAPTAPSATTPAAQAPADAAIDELTHAQRFPTRLSRHEAAIALLQSDRSGRLAQVFATMIEDRDEDTTWRAYCVQYLGECFLREPDPGIRQTMLRLTDHTCPEIAEEAVSMVARWRRREAIDEFTLAEVVRTHLAPTTPALVRIAAVRAIPSIASPTLRPALPPLCAAEVPTAVRVALAQVLGDLGGADSAEMLVALAQGDPSPNVRCAADVALRRAAGSTRQQ